MTLTLQEVEHIALLARLELTREEKERYQQQLSDILDHVAQLQALDTSQIQAASVVQPPMARLRADEALPGLSTEQALQNAPAAEKDQFRVPPVLD
jgi:aspartyl-tRNA(Asn)/glutamyl-tRNA(Gln) amidotransferase subunit C